MRKAEYRPSGLAFTEALERRVAALEDRLRRATAVRRSPACATVQHMGIQSAHGFAAGDVIYQNGTYAKAQADTAAKSAFCGVVSAVLSPDAFMYVSAGMINVGTSYPVAYLSSTTAGALASSESRYGRPVMLGVNGSLGPSIVLPFARHTQVSTMNPLGSGESTYTTSGTYNFSASYPGALYRIMAIGGGGGQGNPATSTTTRYVAATSGGSPTTAVVQKATGGGGGGGGAFVAIVDSSGLASFSYVIGAGGGIGVDGGDTTVTINGSTWYAKGGKKGGDALLQGGGAVNPGYGGDAGESYLDTNSCLISADSHRGTPGQHGYCVTTLDGSGFTYIPNGGISLLSGVSNYVPGFNYARGDGGGHNRGGYGNGVGGAVVVQRITA